MEQEQPEALPPQSRAAEAEAATAPAPVAEPAPVVEPDETALPEPRSKPKGQGKRASFEGGAEGPSTGSKESRSKGDSKASDPEDGTGKRQTDKGIRSGRQSGKETTLSKRSKSHQRSKSHGRRDVSGSESDEAERRKRSKSKSPGRVKEDVGSSGKKKSNVKSPPRSRRDRLDDYSDDFDEFDSMDSHDARHGRKHNENRSKVHRGREERRSDDDDYRGDRTSEHSRDRYEGDVSLWGRKSVPGFYDHHGGSVNSDFTMSSGLSPRDGDGRNHMEFDVEKAKMTLAYNAGLYGKAQALRKEGQAPKTLGIADDLPDRFAYHQLQQLAGMAQKVQDAIQHNTRVFKKRVLTEDLQIKKRVFHGWRAARYGTLAKQQLLRRVLARMMRFKLSRAFFAWKDRFGLVDKNFAMRRKLHATLNKGRMRRALNGWRKVVYERRWKNMLETRDSRIHMLEKKISGFELRPIIIIRKRKLSAVLTAWFNLSEERRRRRMRFERAARHFFNRQMGAAWNSWYAYHLECKRQGDLLSKAASRMKNLKMFQAWNKWTDLIIEKRQKQLKIGRALKFWTNQNVAKAWSTWLQHVLWRREKKKIISRWMQPMKAKALYTWVDHVQWRKRMRVVLDRTARRMKNRTIAAAWDTWRAAVEESKMDFHLTKKEELALQVKAMQEENERLRRDNERFVRLIDSGEWGRGRVSELVSAGEVLKGERDGLMKLIQSMRHEYEAVRGAKGAQEDELRMLKERMLLGGAARNKMLVKGASSYNALKRAIKQDLVDAGGAPAEDPNLLYEIDKLSMERVSVFPDGDLNIEAITSSPGTAAFSRPVGQAQRLRSSMAPTHPVNVPQHLPSRLAANSRPTARTLEIVNRLQGLTPAELDRVEDRLRAEAMARTGTGDRGRPSIRGGERAQADLVSTAPGTFRK